MSRPAFLPTREQRDNVELMFGFGIPETDICRVIKNPETGRAIDAKTLRKHFKEEIATGATKLKALAGQRIAATMLGRSGGIKDPRAEAQMLIFFAKTQMGWSEVSIHKHTGVKGGDPIELEISNARDDLKRKLARLALTRRAGKTSQVTD